MSGRVRKGWRESARETARPERASVARARRSEKPVPIEILVAPRCRERLHEAARARGMTASVYASLLFDAAFAARVGQERGDPPADAELEEQLRLVFCMAGQADTAAIARATGIPEKRVTRLLDGWKQAGRGAA